MENINLTEPSIEASTQTGVPSASVKKPKLTPSFNILKAAVSLWWKNLDKILKIYWEGIKPILVPLAVSAILAFLAFVVLKEGPLSIAVKILASVSAFVTLIFAIYFVTRTYIGVFLLIKKDYKDEALETFKETKPLFWPYIGLSLLTALLVLCWALLLIIPGIIFSVLYSFAIYAFFFEGKKDMEAIRRSRALAKGYFWPIFGRFMLMGIIVLCFTMILSAPFVGMPENSVEAQIGNFIIQVISWIMGPITLFFSYNIYSDLVKIKR